MEQSPEKNTKDIPSEITQTSMRLMPHTDTTNYYHANIKWNSVIENNGLSRKYDKMAKNNLSITIGVSVLDEDKGTDNKFYSAGMVYNNANESTLMIVHEVT